MKEWLELIEEFPDRFVIGSDEFVDESGINAFGGTGYETTWSLIDELPEDLAIQVGYENAEKIYK